MPSNWRKVVVVLSLLIVVVGAVTPDASDDDAIASGTPSSANVSLAHSSDQPFGCQHEEDCFCCAHIAPLAVFEIYPFIGVARAEQQEHVSAVERVPSAPYHPPRA
jgi:hypothetical protein